MCSYKLRPWIYHVYMYPWIYSSGVDFLRMFLCVRMHTRYVLLYVNLYAYIVVYAHRKQNVNYGEEFIYHKTRTHARIL